MATPRRRRLDQGGERQPEALNPGTPEGRAAQTWIQHCVSLILTIEPGMSLEEAKDIATEMMAFERTGMMAPERAVAFVVSQFNKGIPNRIERRISPIL